nr:adenylate/guanylate cyclase domain-containing protein [Flavimaribacter sediminis]
MSLSRSPQIVAFAGFASIAAWSGTYLWVASQPESVARTSIRAIQCGFGPDTVISNYPDPNVVSLTTLQWQVIFLLPVTTIMILTVLRSRRLVSRMVSAEAQRGALSRYFTPDIVRELTSNEGSLDQPARIPAAVLFADLAGFTRLSENLAPKELIELLSEFHGKLARITFSHGGTVENYIGEVLAGNIGEKRRLEYTVLGDTVNVASGLERLTREINASIVVSEELVRAAMENDARPDELVDNLRIVGERPVRGRRQPIRIWPNSEFE